MKKKMPTKDEMVDMVLEQGVRNLRESYPSVTKDNIVTDQIYRVFFKCMLEDDEGVDLPQVMKDARDALLQKIKEADKVAAVRDLHKTTTKRKR